MSQEEDILEEEQKKRNNVSQEEDKSTEDLKNKNQRKGRRKKISPDVSGNEGLEKISKLSLKFANFLETLPGNRWFAPARRKLKEKPHTEQNM